ncbi:glycosyltransferase family 4 protein [Magnetospira thiophila]
MKILYHHRSRSKDGQNVHIEEMIGALRRLGHEVVVAAPEMVEASSGHSGGAVGLLKRLLPKAAYELLELGYSVTAYRRLERLYKKHHPDVLYERYNLYQPAGVRLKRKYGLPMLLEVNAPLVEERDKFGGLALKSLARWSENHTWRGADYCLPVTDVLADHLRAVGVPNDHIQVIPNGINRAHFAAAPSPEEAKRALKLDGKLVLGFTGYVRDWHRLDLVIDLLADAPPETNLHLLLVGDGPVRAELEEQARAAHLEDRITITGFVGRDEVPAYVAAFDIALQPAVTAYASPLKLFEYMFLGRAIVGPDTPNIREILVDGENAVLFDPAVDGAFRGALERVVYNPELRQAIGAGARATIEDRDLTWDGNARRVVALFDSLLKAK